MGRDRVRSESITRWTVNAGDCGDFRGSGPGPVQSVGKESTRGANTRLEAGWSEGPRARVSEWSGVAWPQGVGTMDAACGERFDHGDRSGRPAAPGRADTGMCVMSIRDDSLPLRGPGGSWASMPEPPASQDSAGFDEPRGADAPRVPRAVGRDRASDDDLNELTNDKTNWNNRGAAGRARPHTPVSRWEPRNLPEGRDAGSTDGPTDPAHDPRARGAAPSRQPSRPRRRPSPPRHERGGRTLDNGKQF